MWHFLSWLWSWLTYFAVPLFAMAGFVRLMWMAFEEGRKYQMKRLREMMGRVREAKKELEPSAATEQQKAA